jgi:hypothetical protein
MADALNVDRAIEPWIGAIPVPCRHLTERADSYLSVSDLYLSGQDKARNDWLSCSCLICLQSLLEELIFGRCSDLKSRRISLHDGTDAWLLIQTMAAVGGRPNNTHGEKEVSVSRFRLAPGGGCPKTPTSTGVANG